jgi:hypothetical protein
VTQTSRPARIRTPVGTTRIPISCNGIAGHTPSCVVAPPGIGTRHHGRHGHGHIVTAMVNSYNRHLSASATSSNNISSESDTFTNVFDELKWRGFIAGPGAYYHHRSVDFPTNAGK